ncbi:MAG: FecR domain-containing protein [Chitinophagaceae bacterium]|nr:FecR domain-containing protein [Chitinophagaceae bacterium]
MKDIEGNNREEEAQRIAYLTAGFIKRTLNDAEHDELDAWITASDANQRLFEELISPEGIAKGMQERNAIDTEAALQKIKEQIRFQPQEEKKGKVFQLFYRAAAAVVLIAGAYLIYTMMNRKPNPERVTVQTNAIQPGGNYALFTLGTGKKIRLADMKNGLIDSTDGSEVLKVADGQLSYVDNEQTNEEQHLLTTPIGGQYNVLLPDGSRVWLNAASSLKYPVSFHGKERVVELTGEGYFEVKP